MNDRNEMFCSWKVKRYMQDQLLVGNPEAARVGLKEKNSCEKPIEISAKVKEITYYLTAGRIWDKRLGLPFSFITLFSPYVRAVLEIESSV